MLLDCDCRSQVVLVGGHIVVDLCAHCCTHVFFEFLVGCDDVDFFEPFNILMRLLERHILAIKKNVTSLVLKVVHLGTAIIIGCIILGGYLTCLRLVFILLLLSLHMDS
jgi:hypothetical protein